MSPQAYVAIGHDTDVAEGVSKASGKVFGRGLNTMVLFSGALDSLEPFAEYGLPTDGSVDTAELLLDLYLEGFAVRLTPILVSTTLEISIPHVTCTLPLPFNLLSKSYFIRSIERFLDPLFQKLTQLHAVYVFPLVNCADDSLRFHRMPRVTTLTSLAAS